MTRPPPPSPRCDPRRRRPRAPAPAFAALVALASAALGSNALAASPAELLAGYRAQSGAAPLPARGEALFTARQADGASCAGCHGAVPLRAGRHSSTGKPIDPLAPAADARRFTDAAKAEKWFRRNCRDVLARECSPAEKADLLAWLMSLQP